MNDPKIYLQQHALAALGFYDGALDGINGSKTQSAYDAWRASKAYAGASDFASLVAGWGLRYFTARELLAKGGKHLQNGLNTDPPRELWGNIKDAALAADEARHRLGSGILITSAYRSPAYNKSVGGASGSYHMQFRALDLIPLGVSVSRLHAELKKLRDEGYAGAHGIGRYASFCHTDNAAKRDF